MWRVMFKVEPSLWEMMAQGKKNWDARLESEDPRIVRLLESMADTQIVFWNKESHEALIFHPKAIYRNPPWAPGWLFMELDRRSELAPSGPIAFQPAPWALRSGTRVRHG